MCQLLMQLSCKDEIRLLQKGQKLLPGPIQYAELCGTCGVDSAQRGVNNYRVSQNYPNMQFFAIFATALKPLMLRFPKFSESLIRSQS